MTEEEMLAERKKQHGDFNDHARISQALKAAMWKAVSYGGWNNKLTDTQREALEMIQHKIARILAGDPNHADHWRDIAGYAKITEERLTPTQDELMHETIDEADARTRPRTIEQAEEHFYRLTGISIEQYMKERGYVQLR